MVFIAFFRFILDNNKGLIDFLTLKESGYEKL